MRSVDHEPGADAGRREPVIEAEGLSKSYPVRWDILGRVVERFDAVRDVDLTLGRGETLALVGESGAGKSTVGRLILGLIEPTAGKVSLLGQDVGSLGRLGLRELRGHATMIFQDPYKSFDPRLPLRYSVTEPLIVQGAHPRSVRDARAQGLLDRVGLRPEYLDRYPYEMSGGQLQRMAIARALITDPQVVLCDEPVASLDMSIRSHVINLLRELQQERNLSYVFVSHDLSLVRVVSDRIAVMRSGSIVETGSSERVFEHPQHPYTRELLAAIPARHPRDRTFRSALVSASSRPEPRCQ